MTITTVHAVRRAGTWSGAGDSVTLSHEDRLIRRKRLTTDGGRTILVDLPQVTSLAAGDALEGNDDLIEVRAADEPLLAIRGNLPRLAWHIGNRHTPCQILPDRLLIRHDHVLRDMLIQLGATVTEQCGPFTPEGGAYGHGRAIGHEHGSGHDHHARS